MSTGRAVSITENGRSGYVNYRDAGRELSFYWEFGGGDTVAGVQVGTAADWQRDYRWAAHRRAEILQFVVAEVVRQKAPSCVAEIDERSGWINLRKSGDAPAAPPPAASGFSPRRWQAVRSAFALAVLVVSLVFGGIMWIKNKVLVIDPGKGTPIGLSVRTDRHIATLIQTLEPYTPTLNRDHSKDTYAISLFIVPLDGTDTRHVSISGGHSANSLGLVKVLGSDGRTLWVDVNGVGGVDLETFELLKGAAVPDTPPGNLEGATRFPIAPRTEAYLGAGYFTGPDSWLGLISAEELEGAFKPGKWLRSIVPAEDAKQLRRFFRGTVGDTASTGSRQIVAMAPIGEAGYLNAAFLRMDDASAPLRLADPDGALMVYTSAPGLTGTLMVARVDTAGNIRWQLDTGIDRFRLQQILPGESSFAFVGTRVPVPDKVPEPILVIVDSTTGEVRTHSLWQ